jgi:plasmid stabilization system protein ParE
MAEATKRLRERAGKEVAYNFVAQLETIFARLCNFPHLGSAWPSRAHKGLRRAVLRDFPYSVFYRPTDTTIDVVRVLHHSRDIPPLLEDL